MFVIFLGPPGSGKGTQATILGSLYSFTHISTGDMLREEVEQETALGRRVARKMKRGELIEDKLIIELVLARIRRPEPDRAAGFILDGVPRTLRQVRMITAAGTAIDRVVEFFCDTEVLVTRLASRRVHPASGRIYNSIFNPPKRAGKDDITGEPLVQREDDMEETVRARIQDYYAKTNEVCDYYCRQPWEGVQYHRIDAALAAAEVTQRLRRIFYSRVRSAGS